MTELKGYRKSRLFTWAMSGAGLLVVCAMLAGIMGIGYLADESSPDIIGTWYLGAALTAGLVWAPALALGAYAYEELRVMRLSIQQAHDIKHVEHEPGAGSDEEPTDPDLPDYKRYR